MGRCEGQIRVMQQKRKRPKGGRHIGYDVRLDMDELTAIELSVIGTLVGLSYPTRPWIWASRLRPLEKPGIYVLP